MPGTRYTGGKKKKRSRQGQAGRLGSKAIPDAGEIFLFFLSDKQTSQARSNERQRTAGAGGAMPCVCHLHFSSRQERA